MGKERRREHHLHQRIHLRQRPHDSLKVVREDTCTKGLDYTLKHNSGFTNYSYPGYTFSGWKIVAETASPNTGGFFARMMSVFARRTFAVGNVYNEGDTITALNKNITVEAVWTQNPSQETYRVIYDGNGSTGGEAPTDSTAYAEGATPEVLGQNTLTRTGSSFKGWNTAANGVGTHYSAGDRLPGMTANVTLYAEWESATTQPQKYRVIYDGNGSTGGEAPTDSTEYAEGATPEVLGQNTLTRTGSSFKGWNTAANGGGTHYSAGDRLPGMTANVTLYAEWESATTQPDPDPQPQTYRVIYDGNGATGGNVPEDNAAYEKDDTVTVLHQGDLAKTGYAFKGWNTQADGKGTTYQPSEKFSISGNVTLYAMWSESGEPGNPGTGESALLSALASAALLISSGAALAVIFRRRKRKA